VTDQLARFSAATSVPLFELLQTGTFPSGEALKSAEGSAVRAAEDDAEQATDPLSDMFLIGIKLHNLYAGTSLPTDATITPQWRSFHTRNELLEAQTAQIWQDNGVSQYTTLAEAGYDPEEEAKLKAKEAEAAQAALSRAMDTGQVIPGDSKDDPPVEPNQAQQTSKVAANRG
jgi:hypothetical protein